MKKVLISGDDGFGSIGSRLIIELLKKDYNLTVALSEKQMSATGGMFHIKQGMTSGVPFRHVDLDGIDAYIVDGTPVDAIELSTGLFKDKFDLTISGINWGENVGTALITSGTFASAYRSIGLGVSKKAISLSWIVPQKLWTKMDTKTSLKEYIKSPGEMIKKTIDLAIKNDLWGSKILNINFPEEVTNKYKFTKPLEDLSSFYKYPTIIKDNRFFFPLGDNKKEQDVIFDAAAIQSGYISISPIRADMLDERLFDSLPKEEQYLPNEKK